MHRTGADDRFHTYFRANTTLRTAGEGPGVMRSLLLEALRRLNERLASAGANVTLWMIGGGTMMLHFDARESSGDLDVIPVKGDGPAMMRFVEEIAREMIREGRPIPIDWLNYDFLPQFQTLNAGPKDFESDPRYRWSNLEIKFAKAELMIALKCLSLRSEGNDITDLTFLLKTLPIKSIDHLYDIIEHYGDIDMLMNGDDVLIEDLCRQVIGQRGQQ